MYLATEYLVRSGIAKKMLRIPCSLFLTDFDDNRRVITIGHGYRLNEHLVVKHWFITTCTGDQALPSMREYLVLTDRLFCDPHVILDNHRLLKYREQPVPSHLNGPHHPMLAETYHFYADNFFDTHAHRVRRENWLWEEFVRIYFPNLMKLCFSVFQYRSQEDAAEDQRHIISQHYPERWLYWLKWRKYLLDFEGLPAELIFSKEYRSYRED